MGAPRAGDLKGKQKNRWTKNISTEQKKNKTKRKKHVLNGAAVKQKTNRRNQRLDAETENGRVLSGKTNRTLPMGGPTKPGEQYTEKGPGTDR